MTSYNILEKFHTLLEIVGVMLVVIIGVTVTLRIASRPLEFLPEFLWTGEIARYSLALLTIVGIPYAMRTDDHISIRPLLKSLSGNYQTVLFMVTNVLIAAFCLLIAYSSFVVSKRTLDTPLPTVRWLNYGYVNLVMVVMFLLTTVYTIISTRNLWQEYRTSSQAETGTSEAGTGTRR